MYAPFQVTVTGKTTDDLEAMGRELAFMQMGGSTLLVMERNNRTLVQGDETFTEATFTFVEVPGLAV